MGKHGRQQGRAWEITLWKLELQLLVEHSSCRFDRSIENTRRSPEPRQSGPITGHAPSAAFATLELVPPGPRGTGFPIEQPVAHAAFLPFSFWSRPPAGSGPRTG